MRNHTTIVYVIVQYQSKYTYLWRGIIILSCLSADYVRRVASKILLGSQLYHRLILTTPSLSIRYIILHPTRYKSICVDFVAILKGYENYWCMMNITRHQYRLRWLYGFRRIANSINNYLERMIQLQEVQPYLLNVLVPGIDLYPTRIRLNLDVL